MGLINDGVNKLIKQPIWEKSLPLFPLLLLNFDDHFPFLIFNNYNNLQRVTLSFIMKHWTAWVSDERHFRHPSALYDCNQKQMRRHAFSSHSITFSRCGVCSRAISGCLQREIRFQHEGVVVFLSSRIEFIVKTNCMLQRAVNYRGLMTSRLLIDTKKMENVL